VVTIEDVSQSFPTPSGDATVVLEKMNLDIAAGEFVSLVGPSGCGKSTLLRIIAGFVVPTSGRVVIDGETVNGVNPKIGFVFQDPNLFPWQTVRDNVNFGPAVRGEKRGAEVDEMLERVGLTQFAGAWPQHLSGGMAQRAALARALINHPPVLLLDEPLGALDAFTRMAMQDTLRELTRASTTILVTHDIDEALYLSDRVVILSPRPGRIRQEMRLDAGFSRARNAPDFLLRRKRI
jgi:ABC-type nitrate/sulfonate/bicarbonate transport system ATPase subunit